MTKASSDQVIPQRVVDQNETRDIIVKSSRQFDLSKGKDAQKFTFVTTIKNLTFYLSIDEKRMRQIEFGQGLFVTDDKELAGILRSHGAFGVSFWENELPEAVKRQQEERRKGWKRTRFMEEIGYTEEY